MMNDSASITTTVIESETGASTKSTSDASSSNTHSDIKPILKLVQSKKTRVLSFSSLKLPRIPVNHEHRTLLETLADIASEKSPVKKNSDKRTVSITTNPVTATRSTRHSNGASVNSSNSSNNTWGDDNRWQRGRPRAMSEPHIIDDRWIKTLHDIASNVLTTTGSSSSSSGGTNLFIGKNESSPGVDKKYVSSFSMVDIDDQSSMTSTYNKNGRIGIYTRDERQAILQRFYEKRKRRVWKKKIRYHCRKNLADRRVRVKGRFVKAADDGAGSATSTAPSRGGDNYIGDDDESESDDDDYDDDYDDANAAMGSLPSISKIHTAEKSIKNSDSSASSGSITITSTSATNNNNDDTAYPPLKRVRRHSIAY